MLQTSGLRSALDRQPHLQPGHSGVDLSTVFGVLKRQWPLVVGVLALLVGISLVYLFTAQPKYRANVLLLIDTRKFQLFQQQSGLGEVPMDTAAVTSQVEVLRSQSVANAVVKELRLTEDPEFVEDQRWLASLIDAFTGPNEGSPAPDELLRRASGHLQSNLTISRVGTTYVIDIAYRSIEAEKAARVANAVAESYIQGELEAKYEATKRASLWLQDRIAELRQQAFNADRAVQSFKAENELVNTGRGLMGEQQLGELNTQLVLARAQTAEAKARVDRMAEISRQDLPEASVADALKNDVITRLRGQYLDLAAREADFSVRFGQSHTATANLRNQMREIKKSIADEVRRIGEGYKSDLQIARTREESIQRGLSDLIKRTATTNQAQVSLRELESSSQTYRTLYDSFLQRFNEATQQQSFPITEARVLSGAHIGQKSEPKTALVLGLAGALGLLIGVGTAFAREALDNEFRTPAQLEAITGVECLGVLPIVSSKNTETKPCLRTGEQRSLPNALGMARYVVEEPFSRFTETIRGVKVAVDLMRLTRASKTIGVVSALPNEGKTTVAANIAQLLAHAGHKTLLIDADLRNPSLTKALAPSAEEGVLELLRGRRRLTDLVWSDPVTGLEFLPAVVGARVSHTADLISSPSMAELLENAKGKFEYVVLDFPPIAPVIDVKAAAHLIDSLVLVVEWGQTSHQAVTEALESVDIVRAKLIGALLNKADSRLLNRLESYKGRYYSNYYGGRRSNM